MFALSERNLPLRRDRKPVHLQAYGPYQSRPNGPLLNSIFARLPLAFFVGLNV